MILDRDIYNIAIFASIFLININGLVQERRNSIALAMEFRLSCFILFVKTPYI